MATGYVNHAALRRVQYPQGGHLAGKQQVAVIRRVTKRTACLLHLLHECAVTVVDTSIVDRRKKHIWIPSKTIRFLLYKIQMSMPQSCFDKMYKDPAFWVTTCGGDRPCIVTLHCHTDSNPYKELSF